MVPLSALRRAVAGLELRRSGVNGNPSVNRGQFWSLAARMAQFNVQKLAEHSSTTRRQIERYCLKELGRSPQEWLMEQRIIAARSLLLETGSVKRAALEVGFKQVSHFCRQFKQHYRMTPSEYLVLQARLNQKCR
jgi:transcriptional regulator GlxA family with amidase domain